MTAARAGSEVTLWGTGTGGCGIYQRRGVNEMFLPGVKLPDTLRAVNDLAAMVMQDALLMVGTAPNMWGLPVSDWLRGRSERLSPYNYLQ